MALIVSLDRGALKLDLGDFESVALVGYEVVVPEQGDRIIAKHIHNRWIAQGDAVHHLEESAFMSLNVAGPLTVTVHREGGRDAELGPYLSFAMTDGILYVDQRVFGMWDSQTRDWYLKDAGAHCKRFRVSFRATD